jgi:hypothetical protein
MKAVTVLVFMVMALSPSYSCGKIPQQTDDNKTKTTTTLPQGEGCSDGSSPLDEDEDTEGFTIKL